MSFLGAKTRPKTSIRRGTGWLARRSRGDGRGRNCYCKVVKRLQAYSIGTRDAQWFVQYLRTGRLWIRSSSFLLLIVDDRRSGSYSMKFSKLLLAIFFYSMIEGWENMESNSLLAVSLCSMLEDIRTAMLAIHINKCIRTSNSLVVYHYPLPGGNLTAVSQSLCGNRRSSFMVANQRSIDLRASHLRGTACFHRERA